MNLSPLSKIVLVSAVVSLFVVVGVFYFAPTNKIVERVVEKLGAAPGPGFDNPYVTFNGIDYYYGNQPMIATSTSLCVFANPFAATSTLLGFTSKVTANRTGANQTIDLSTTTVADGFGSSSPPFVLARGITTTGSGSSAGRELSWFPSTATTTKSGGASGAGVMEAFNSVTGESNAIIRAGEFLTLRVATATAMTVTAGTNDITGSCQAIYRKN